MKKLSLSTQIIIILVIIFLLSSVAFSLTSLSVIKRIVRDETYSTLSSYAILLDEDSDEQMTKFKIDVSYIVKTDRNMDIYDPLNIYKEEDVEGILKDVYSQREKYSDDFNSFIVRSTYENKNYTIYYAYKTEDNMHTFTLVFTNETTSNPFFISLVARINLIFFVIMIVTLIVLFLWINSITRRLKNIQRYVLDLTNENQSSKIDDNGLDEVSELSRSVEHMKEEILHNDKIKQEMLQNLSHDFKTPIAVIKNYAEAIDDEVEEPKLAAKKIVEQADILKNKVTKLLQYNSLEYLSKDRDFEDVDMGEIISDILVNYKYQLSELNVEVTKEDDVFFKGYKENWYTVVENIIDNAKRYAKSEIKILLKKDKLVIYNDGDPLEEKFIKDLFKPYEKGSSGQFGLGMSIVQKTVSFFNYNLKAKNENIGVSFIIEAENDK